MSAPRDAVSGGEFPTGPFQDSPAGRAAMRYAQLAWAVRYERQKRGWSQAKLAKQVNVSRATVSRLESGEQWTHPELVFLIIDELGVDTTFDVVRKHWDDKFGL